MNAAAATQPRPIRPATNARRADSAPPPPVEAAAPKKRSRLFRALEIVASVALVLSASVGVAWGVRKYVTTSPRFAVRSIAVEGNAHRTPEQVASMAGITLGDNVFALDYERAGGVLLRDPWIAKATVTRQLPGTVKISVVEREPRALASVGQDLYLVTREGEPFKKLEAGDPTDLVVVTGVDPGAFQRDRVGASLQVKRALDVVEDLERAGLAKRWPAQEVHLDKDGSVGVTLGKEAILLQLGQPPFREKIEAGKAVLAEVARRKANASVVFLDNEAHPERVVVRMR